jgi:aspartate-semialdehyde dehydrogenase
MTTLAIVHPTTLLGKELRECLGRGNASIPWQELRLLSTLEEEVGTLTDAGDAAALVQRYEPGSLDKVSAAFFCGPAAANRPLLAELPAEVTAVLLSPDAGVADGYPVVAGINSRPGGTANVLLSPHPAVVLLAHLLQPLAAACDPRQVAATVIQPASTFDEPGVEELFEQTRQIVAMTERRPAAVFGAQLAFNLLPAMRANEAAADIAAALAAVLPEAPPLAVQLLQGGVFHGLAVSLHLRADNAPSLPALRKALLASPYVAAAGDAAHLGPIDAAASDKILLGPLRKDEQGIWIWAVVDNLTRGGALNAIEIAAAVN